MSQPVPTLAPRRRAPTWLWVMLVMLSLSVLIVLSAFNWVSSFDGAPVHVVVEGHDAWGFDPGTLSLWDKSGILAAAVVAVFTVLVIVPVALLIGLAALLVALVLGLGVPLMGVLLVCALALSPLWLLVVFVWWLWRRSTPATPHAA